MFGSCEAADWSLWGLDVCSGRATAISDCDEQRNLAELCFSMTETIGAARKVESRVRHFGTTVTMLMTPVHIARDEHADLHITPRTAQNAAACAAYLPLTRGTKVRHPKSILEPVSLAGSSCSPL